MLIIAIILLGVIAGGLARWVVASLTGARFARSEAFGAGIAGSFVGGLLFSLLAGDGVNLAASGVFGSTLGAMMILGVWAWVRGRQAWRADQ